jgi:hypothetical protein
MVVGALPSQRSANTNRLNRVDRFGRKAECQFSGMQLSKQTCN